MITIITGEQGTGKSTILTYKLYKAYNLGWDIFCNYYVDFPHLPIAMTHFENLRSDDLVNACVGIDEAENIVDSRTSLAKANRLIVSWIYQSRKRNIDLYLCNHLLTALDLRIRQEANYVIEAAGYDPSLDTVTYYQLSRSNGTSKRTKLRNCRQIFKLFDTRERIANERTLDSFSS